MSIQKFKSGTNQDDRTVSALKPGYVSVEERSVADLLKYSREYAKDVRYYGEKGGSDQESYWTSFLDFDDDEITQLVEFSRNPELFKDDETVLERFSKPHLAMLLAFIRLLDYPREKFAGLTGKKLEFFYRDVLRLNQLDEVPDQAHVVFKLARDVKERLLEKGTLFYAGKDDSGADLHYEAMEDIVINKGHVSDVKTLHFKTATSDIKHVHLSAGRGDAGFEQILCLALGGLEALPDYYTAYGEKVPVDGRYLRGAFYDRIQGREKDDLTGADAGYIFDSLCFRYMKDFRYCLDIYYREMNRGYVGVASPEESEWEKVYEILQGVHKEKTARARRDELKQIHKSKGFDSMMEYAFGEPEPWNMLYKMPGEISTLEELYAADHAAAGKYIEKKLCMTVDDFRVIMKKKDDSLNTLTGNEVYTLLEEAWTRKRGFVYPVIGSQIVEGFQADTVFSTDGGDEGIKRFKPFGNGAETGSGDSIDMGFAVSSPLLELAEGSRKVEIVLSCRPGTIDHGAIAELLEEKKSLVKASLTTAGGWMRAGDTQFETGKFIVGPEEKTYNSTHSFPVCDVLGYEGINEQSAGGFLVFENRRVYRIERYERENGRIVLRSVFLEYDADRTRMISSLVPTGFVDELKLPVEASANDLVVKTEGEVFDEYFEGKYFVDNGGRIFFILSFVSASEVAVRYCGNVSDPDDLLVVNRVWESIVPTYADNGEGSDIGTLSISGIYSDRGIFDPEEAESNPAGVTDQFEFEVADDRLVIRYPEGVRAEHLIEVWNRLLDDSPDLAGRFEMKATGDARWSVSPVSKDMEKTGEVIRRYESPDQRGISITHTGRADDRADLVIASPSDVDEHAGFSTVDGTLTITPGTVSGTTGQIAADWQIWSEDKENNCAGFKIESKDQHVWEFDEVEQVRMAPVDKIIKTCDVHDSYGNGIRVLYTGPESHRPRVHIRENTTGLFEFEVDDRKLITILYPNSGDAAAVDLMDAWCGWKSSGLNDAGGFEIEQLGDGLWTVAGRTELELKSCENQIMECAIEEAGIVAGYQLSGEYENAVVQLKEEPGTSRFSFGFDEFADAAHGDKKTRRLAITYPPLAKSSDDEIQQFYQERHVQELLMAWNRIRSKHGFTLVRKEGRAEWSSDSFTDPLVKNFLDDLSYVVTVHPDGFKVKFKPHANWTPPFTAEQSAVVVIEENDSEDFGFHLTNDYPNNLKILFIKYPVIPKKRTVEGLLAAWEAEPHIDKGEFSIEQAGKGKWRISGVTDKELTSEVTAETELTDPVNQRFFEYRTDDLPGYDITYSGPVGMAPEITVRQGDGDGFGIDVTTIFDEFHDVHIESALAISVPAKRNRRKAVHLLKAWRNWKKSRENRFGGFEIFDTSPVVEARSKAPLLVTGDEVRAYSPGAGDGLCVTYTGHRPDVHISLEPVAVFTDGEIGRKIVWDDGLVYTVTERLDNNNILVEESGSMDRHPSIRQYESDALCLDALKVTVGLEPDFPAVTGMPGQAPSSLPSVKIILNSSDAEGTGSADARLYEAFRSICMQRADLNVHVAGLTNLAMRNDLAVIHPEKAFDPFGLTPDAGSAFSFANREICEKKLDSLRLNMDWDGGDSESGIPDMADHYFVWSRCGRGDIGTVKNSDFQVNLEFLDQRTWQPVSQNSHVLFGKSLEYGDLSKQTYRGEMFRAGEETPGDPRHWARYYRLSLTGREFMGALQADVEGEIERASNALILAENNYEAVRKEIKAREAAVKAGAEASQGDESYNPAVIAEVGDLPVIPENDRYISRLDYNRAYTPRLNSLTIDYSASSRVVLDDSDTRPDYSMVPSKLFRFHPFGFAEIGGADDEDDFLLPQYDMQGYLYIGVKELTEQQNVSILFQMISGSGEAGLSMPDVNWSYCASDRWKPFKKSDILADRTKGLQDTGIIRFRLPEDATSENTVLPTGRFWIRAEAADRITAFPDILDLKAQSVEVRYVNKDNDPMRLETPLEAHTITSLVERDPAIREVLQPYSSFDGYKREEAEDFHVRVSEMLRHKNRALLLGDYEKIILSAFPGVYKVKCLPQNEMKILDHTSEGEVKVVVILKNEKATPFYPLKPKTPAGVLEEIEDFLKGCMPPLVSVTVINPRFEEIRYRTAVKFSHGHDRGFCMNRLNEDIKKFLSPWAYAKDAEVSFGSTVYSSSVINHIEKLDYVDYVANFNLLEQVIVHDSYREVLPLFLSEDNAATVKYPDSILVSAEEHMIDVIETEYYDPGAFRGIGYMHIGTDFWINRPGPVFSVGISEMEIESWPVPRYVFSTLPVKVKVTGTVNGVAYVKEDFETRFTGEDSQRIWNALNERRYIDAQGKVIGETADKLYEPDFRLQMPGDVTFTEYLNTHLASFSFALKAEDFNPDAECDASFEYSIAEVNNSDGIEEEIIAVLRSGESFDGLSQYPFHVY